MNAIAVPAPSSSAPKAAWICLLVAWVCFLIPFPGLGLFVGWPLNLVAFILAIVAMAKRGAGAGIGQLLASLIGSPIVYFLGLAIFAGTIGVASEAARLENAPKVEIASIRLGKPDTAQQLASAYQAAGAEANKAPRGKLNLEVSGTVGSIESVDGQAVVVLTDGSGSDGVRVKGLEAAAAAALVTGQSLTVTCKDARKINGVPMLDACAIK